MSKLSSVTHARIERPWYKDQKLALFTINDSDLRITGFVVTLNGEKKEFPVKNFAVLAAWQQMEQYLKNLK